MRRAISNKTIARSNEEFELRRGPWTLEEDKLLTHYITFHGEGRWNLLAKCAGLRRTGKSCRLRWLNYLKPDIKRGNLTPKEQLLILELHSKWGNRWSKIAQHLPGRTDNEIKNYWRTRVQKQARQLKIDSNSHKFLEAIRCFWMPRLLEKMAQASSSSSSSSSISTMETQNLTIPSQLSNQTPINEKSFPSSYSSDSTQKSQVFDILKNPESPPAQSFGNTGYSNSVLDDYYQVDISNFDMECFNNSVISTQGSGDFSFSERHISDWVNGDMGPTFWDMDELWQYRMAEEVVGV
ncbi:unnamed protein product [Ilex paraguariensis]|uniref:Uncharacterized protein n=1 Tax=Ilex paraguariensis TaxID=185542 RepID=A0ABC8SRL8_9AQUA